MSIDICQICRDNQHNMAIVPCGHVICSGCYNRIAYSSDARCPFCRTPMVLNNTDSCQQRAPPAPPAEPAAQSDIETVLETPCFTIGGPLALQHSIYKNITWTLCLAAFIIIITGIVLGAIIRAKIRILVAVLVVGFGLLLFLCGIFSCWQFIRVSRQRIHAQYA